MTFTEAMNYANGGYKVRRRTWRINQHVEMSTPPGKALHIVTVDNELNKFGERNIMGMPYSPTIADINCPDWMLRSNKTV
jgi:hypothetical protein